MMTVYHLFKGSVARRIATAVLGIFLLTTSTMFGQGDRSERLQERVTSSQEWLDISRTSTPAPINSLAQQALRKAQARVNYAKAKLAEARALLTAALKRDHSGREHRDTKQEVAQVKAARAEVDAAYAHLRDAQEAARLEEHR